MGAGSAIEWTDDTWPAWVSGCTRVSAGCEHCYIERTVPFRVGHRKFDRPGIGGTTGVQLHPERVSWPLRRQAGRKIFVNSQADIFHDQVPAWLLARAFAVMAAAPRHTFQVLTKRPPRMRSLLDSVDFRREIRAAARDGLGLPRAAAELVDQAIDRWPLPNVWTGVSVEDQRSAEQRIPILLDTVSAARFISAEPLLARVELAPEWLHSWLCPMRYGGPLCACTPGDGRLDWVIAGGESGPAARPMHPDWARSLRDQCVSAGVPFFFKQWGEWLRLDDEARDIIGCDDPRLSDGQSRRGDYRQTVRVERRYLEDELFVRVGKKDAGRELDGRTWVEFPARAAA